MLPEDWSRDLCSLNPGEDRMAFSLEWKINDVGELISERMRRSIIRSCAKLSYDHVQVGSYFYMYNVKFTEFFLFQSVIDDRADTDWPEIRSPFTKEHIIKSINILQYLAIRLRRKRLVEGALKIDLPRTEFIMHWGSLLPIECRPSELKESNRLVEEFMILANTRVAQKIVGAFPSIAVLRRHPEPFMDKLQQLSTRLQNLDIFLDFESSSTLQTSLSQYESEKEKSIAISFMVAKTMKVKKHLFSSSICYNELPISIFRPLSIFALDL